MTARMSFKREERRPLISPAAFSVKVMAATRPMSRPFPSFPPARRRNKRRSVRRVVFPVPAPASTTTFWSRILRAMSRYS